MIGGLRFREAHARLSPLLAQELDVLVKGLQAQLRPRAAITATDTSTVNSGDATTDTVIDNLRTRLSELESRLQDAGLLE